jgi:hypothetical protein
VSELGNKKVNKTQEPLCKAHVPCRRKDEAFRSPQSPFFIQVYLVAVVIFCYHLPSSPEHIAMSTDILVVTNGVMGWYW